MEFNNWDTKPYLFLEQTLKKAYWTPARHMSENRGDFYRFDRIFYTGKDRLWLFSKSAQELMEYDFDNYTRNQINLGSQRVYADMEYCGDKLFCLDAEGMAVEVYYRARKTDRFYEKRTFELGDSSVRPSPAVQMKVWKETAPGERVFYRCLLGPLDENLFLYCDLKERLFDKNEKKRHAIHAVNFIRISDDAEGDERPPAVVSYDAHTDRLVCFHLDKEVFFEYNEFNGGQNRGMEVVNRRNASVGENTRMYSYYPHLFFDKRLYNQYQSYRQLKEMEEEGFRHLLVCTPGSDCLVIVQPGEIPEEQEGNQKGFPAGARKNLGKEPIYYCKRYFFDQKLALKDVAVDTAQGGFYVLADQAIIRILPSDIRELDSQNPIHTRDEGDSP